MGDSSLSKPVIIAFIMLLSALAGIWYSGIDKSAVSISKFQGNARPIIVAGYKIYVEIADSPEKWRKGLSDRESLAKNRGMLFVFPDEDYYSIWMKDMNFPLDIFWIDKDGYVLDMWTDAAPDSYPSKYIPKEPAKYVLETNAGFAELYNIEIGDKIGKLPK